MSGSSRLIDVDATNAVAGEVSPGQLMWSGDACYHWLIWPIASIGPTVPLLSIWVLQMDDRVEESEKKLGTAVLAATTLFVLILYAVTFPRYYEVWRPAVPLERLQEEGATVNVVTLLHSWEFTGCVRATHVPGWCGIAGHSLLRGLVKFATDPECRVLLRRRCGRYDVVVSPLDPSGIVEAVWHASSLTDDRVLGATPGLP